MEGGWLVGCMLEGTPRRQTGVKHPRRGGDAGGMCGGFAEARADTQ